MSYREPARRLPPLPPPETGSYEHLARIAAALGVPYRGAARLEANVGDHRVIFGLELNSGSVVGLTMVAKSGPYPEMKLRREGGSDREGKQRGISREVQTGDALFDEQIYIETDSEEAPVRALLSEPAVRRAILELVSPSRTLTLGDFGVLLDCPLQNRLATSAELAPATLQPLLDALLVVAGTPPVYGGRVAKRGLWLPLASGLVGIPLGTATAILGIDRYSPLTAWLPIGGAALLVVVWFAVRGLVARSVSGDSRSFGRYRVTLGLLFVDAVLWGIATPIVANGALDSSAAVELHGTATDVTYDSDDQSTRASITWSDGSVSTHTFSGTVDRASKVTAHRHRGALGVPWFERGIIAASP